MTFFEVSVQGSTYIYLPESGDFRSCAPIPFQPTQHLIIDRMFSHQRMAKRGGCSTCCGEICHMRAASKKVVICNCDRKGVEADAFRGSSARRPPQLGLAQFASCARTLGMFPFNPRYTR